MAVALQPAESSRVKSSFTLRRLLLLECILLAACRSGIFPSFLFPG
jgi:hypothetical protein